MYGHMTVSELESLRDRLLSALHDRLLKPTSAESSGHRVTFQQQPTEIRKALSEVNAELDRRNGCAPRRGPIYMVGSGR